MFGFTLYGWLLFRCHTFDQISAMTRADAGTRYMVVDQDRLLGVVSLKDLREYIALKLELEPPPR